VRVDPEYYRTMVRVSIRLMQTLENGDLTQYAPDWGIVRTNLKGLTTASFQAGVDASATQKDWLAQFDAIFDLVRKGDYAGTKPKLAALRTSIQSSLTTTAATNPLANVDRVIALANKGANLPN
jgi:hypothetical protein